MTTVEHAQNCSAKAHAASVPITKRSDAIMHASLRRGFSAIIQHFCQDTMH